MADAQQTKSLTTGEDVIKKRKLTPQENVAQPNKKREGSHLSVNIFATAFVVAGQILTQKGYYRGDKDWFVLAFGVAIGLTFLDILLNIILGICAGRIVGMQASEDDQGACCKTCGVKCVSVTTSFLYVAGTCTCIALLVVALVKSDGVEATEACGCANNFGCANIMAIIAVICYGFRFLAIVICLPCLLCVGCLACSACCVARAGQEAATEAGQAVVAETSAV